MENTMVVSESSPYQGYAGFRRHLNNVSNRFLLAYCCLGILLFPLYQYQIDPDGISYINIAHLYAIGDFHDAINGYWGPLVSWLLVPFFWAKLQPLFACKILSLIAGFFTLIAIRKLSRRFAFNERVRLLISLAAIPMLLSFTFLGIIGADLLLLCLSIFYLYYLFDANYSEKVTSGFLIGLLGALMFLSKSYGFYFFLAHFSLFTFIYYIRSKTATERRDILIKYMFGLTIFLIISGIWIYSLSSKYQRFTISTSGVHNMQLDSPGSQGQPVLYQGLLPLPYPAAVSAWDDPSNLIIEYEKSPRLFDWITFQIVHLGENVVHTFYYFELFSIFSIVVLLIFTFRYITKCLYKAREGILNPGGRSWKRQFQSVRNQNEEKLHSCVLYSLITILLYTAGFELLHIEVPYLLIDSVILLFLCASFTHKILIVFINNTKLYHMLYLIIFLSFWLYPIMLLIVHVNQDRGIYMMAKQLQTTYHLKGNLASNDDGDSTNSWGLTLFYAYFLDSKYYGAAQVNVTNEELQRELGKYHIDYYFVWDGTCRLSQCRKIAEFEVSFLWTYGTKHLIVYQVKNNSS